MKVVRTPAGMHEWRDRVRRKRRTVGLVPTMGSLHAGHISLLEASREADDRVVMSLFVNPTQFGPEEGLETYPRDEQRDLEIAAESGVDLVYVPDPAGMYPSGFATSVAVEGLTDVLEGAPGSRGPGHFTGVTTVVAKLLNAADPDRAYFGQKDAQQAAVIRRMVADLEFRQEIVVLPTVRDEDGLALSSRNLYLDPDSRRLAGVISAALLDAESVTAERGLTAGLAAGRARLVATGIEPEYFEARDPRTLEAVTESLDQPVLIAAAARIGGVRLIDNIVIEPNQPVRSTR